ncbi:hypothetical protein VPHD69_0111 [Vibrio phage D69]
MRELPPLNEDGIEVNMQDMLGEFLEQNLVWFADKKEEFETALSERCEKDNEVYNSLGFDQRIQMDLYQIGMHVYGIQVTPHGIQYQIVGQMGQ